MGLNPKPQPQPTLWENKMESESEFIGKNSF